MNISQLLDALEAHDQGQTPTDLSCEKAQALLEQLLGQAQHEPRAMTRALRARLLRVEPRWGASARELQLLLALPESQAQWLACLDARGLQPRQLGLNDDALDEVFSLQLRGLSRSEAMRSLNMPEKIMALDDVHRYLLNLEDVQARPRLWLALMMRCDEAQRRRLLELRSLESQPSLLPSMAALLRVSGASTRQQLIEGVVGSRLVAAEPLLMHVAQDEREDLNVRRAALLGLVDVGTRQCIALLHDASLHDALREPAQAAQLAIEARYPESTLVAREGSLSMLAPEGPRGALSLMGVDEGAISLYEDVLAALEAPAADASDLAQPSALALRPEVARLGAPPRHLNRWIKIVYANAFGVWNGTHFVLFVIGLVMCFRYVDSADADVLVGALIAVSVLSMLMQLIMGAVFTSRELSVLRLGQLTQARRTLRERFEDNFFATFSYQDEQGRTHSQQLPTHLRYHRRVGDDEVQHASYREAIEPILYMEGGEGPVLFVDALPHVRVGAHGQLELTIMAWVKLLIYFGVFYGVPLTVVIELALI